MRIVLSLFVILCLTKASDALAQDWQKDDVPFHGYFSVAEDGTAADGAVVRLSVRLENESADHVFNGKVILQNPTARGAEYGSYEKVMLRPLGRVLLQKSFIVPRAEVERWQQGGSPALRLEFSTGPASRRVHVVPVIQVANAANER
jgi:hypothetical protein